MHKNNEAPVGRVLVLLLLASLVATAAGCAAWRSLKRLPQEEGLNPRLTRYTYLEEGKLVSLAVDVQATLRRGDTDYVPLAVGVGNLGLETLTVTRESFTLVSPEGRRYGLASLQEVKKEFGALMQYDLRLSTDFVGVFANNMDPFPRERSVFYPTTSPATSTTWGQRNLLINRVQLYENSWLVDVLYFPKPEGGWLGERFELWLDTEELEEPVFVKFAVK
jgi:hypothetical protein